ncbi:MAG: hypothetical protein QW069_08665 [Candidatus Caldarchaeum sp.]
MRAGMQDPIITLRNMLTSPSILDSQNHAIPVFSYWGEEILRKSSGVSTWIAVGEPSGSTPRETWLSLPGMGYRLYRSLRYPVYVGGFDMDGIYRALSEIMKRVREQRTSHSAAPEYIEFMYVETVLSGGTQYEETTPPMPHFIIYIVVEFLEL